MAGVRPSNLLSEERTSLNRSQNGLAPWTSPAGVRGQGDTIFVDPEVGVLAEVASYWKVRGPRPLKKQREKEVKLFQSGEQFAKKHGVERPSRQNTIGYALKMYTPLYIVRGTSVCLLALPRRRRRGRLGPPTGVLHAVDPVAGPALGDRRHPRGVFAPALGP